MDCEKTGKLIFELRKAKAMTQKELAESLHISDKAISKWERGAGCPDVSMLPVLADLFEVTIEDLLAGKIALNDAVGGNMKKMKFYVCPQCANFLTSSGEATLSCCGKRLEALEAKKADVEHFLQLEKVEDQQYVSSRHEMTKTHYISFVACVTGDKALLVKQYPEWNLSFRFHVFGHGKLYFFCSQHGLFYQMI